MTSEGLVTAPEGTTLEQAQEIFGRHRIEKLPVVDAEGRITGLITVKDINKKIKYPNATKDRDGRLLVGDGPFAETTEIVGGLYVLTGTRDEVVAIAAGVPVHPDGGVELRPVIDLDG